jgi:hypothetical protein
VVLPYCPAAGWGRALRLVDRDRSSPNALGDTEAPPPPQPDRLGEVIPLRGPRAQPVARRRPLPVAAPSGTAPSGTASSTAASSAAASSAAAPSGTASSGTAPSGTAPSGTAPSGTAADPPAADPAGMEETAKVRGVRCSRQHFNNPIALYCRVCGISMLQQTHIQVLGERPPLGVLVCDDGATFSLDADYVVGTDPSADPAVAEQRARPLRLGEQGSGVEPAHVLISCEGWEVVLVNRARQSPAAVWNRGTPSWVQLGPGGRAVLAPGSHVAFGNRRLVFESNTRA